MFDFIIRLKNSVSIIYRSLGYMLNHKQLLLFPIFNTVLIILSIPISYLPISIFFGFIKAKADIDFVTIILLYSYLAITIYMLASIINTFTNVCLSHNLLTILENKPESFWHSLKVGFNKLNIISQWATLYSIMHYSLSVIMIPHEHDKDKEKSKSDNPLKTLGKLSEFSWELTTFLVYPVIANENVHITTLYKHSIDLLKQKFGENIIAKFSLRVINFLLTILLLATVAFIFSRYNNNISSILVISTLFIFICSLINEAQTIFKTCVYSYTKDQSSGAFPKELIHKYLI